jgi:hypothetical protein
MSNNIETRTQVEKMAKFMETILEKLSNQKASEGSISMDPDLERLDGKLD